MAMRVSVRLFAVLRECAGQGSLELELKQGATVAEAIDALRHHPGLEKPLAEIAVATAVNRHYASRETVLSADDELALVPPVSGGGTDTYARVTSDPLSIEQVTDCVVRPGAGAVVVFQGSTRDVERLD